MKKLIPAYILSFVISFMVWIYEPITMYANNIEDLWFNIQTIIGPLLLVFAITFILLSGLYSLVYYFNNRFFKKIPLYKIILIVSFIGFYALYIQGNYLVYNLPPLDGSIINWGKYTTDIIISIVLWLVIIVVSIVLIKKIKYEKTINIYKYGSLIVFAMLFVSLISTVLTTHVLDSNQEPIEFTMDNFNDASTDKNFYMFLVDAVDSVMFEEVLDNSEYKDTFKDFSYYKDAISGYGFTRDSIPFIFSGIWNDNSKDFVTYSNDAFDNSKFLDALHEKKYNINLYDMDIVWNTKKTKMVANTSDKHIYLKKGVFYRQEAKYFIYKYFPYFLKNFSYIETMDYNRCKHLTESSSFDWDNNFVYDNISDNEINKINKKNFQYIHAEGGHYPFTIDENLNRIENGTYRQKLRATLKIINTFIEKLKENEVYDNSVIIVLADHGYSFTGFDGRQNPILFIKGVDEHHDMINSNIPISYADLSNSFIDLLDDKKSTELFSKIESDRKRRYLWYKYTEEDHMVEYEQTGKAWDEDTLKPTGKEFNR